MHIDVDVYEPTKYCIEQLYDKVVPGGLVVFDDYSVVTGATKAIDEFITSVEQKLSLQKLPFYKIPAFIVKP